MWHVDLGFQLAPCHLPPSQTPRVCKTQATIHVYSALHGQEQLCKDVHIVNVGARHSKRMQLSEVTAPSEEQLQKERQEAADESAHWYLYVYKVSGKLSWCFDELGRHSALPRHTSDRCTALPVHCTCGYVQVRSCYKSYPHNWWVQSCKERQRGKTQSQPDFMLLIIGS